MKEMEISQIKIPFALCGGIAAKKRSDRYDWICFPK